MISVVIPLFNKESRIEKTIASVLAQEGDFEVVVIDDGSVDKSGSLVQKIKDQRLSYSYQENRGPSSARNHGVRKATGEWILFLDADDELLPGAIDHFSNLIYENPDVEVFSCNFYRVHKGKKRLYSRFYKEGVLKNNFRSWKMHQLMPCQGSTIYKKNLLLNETYNEKIRRYEDAELLFNIMRTCKWYTSKKPVFSYCLDYSSASRLRPSIKEDFCGYLSWEGKPFWEQVVLYDFYKMAYKNYPEEASVLYDNSHFSWKVRCINCIVTSFMNVIPLMKKTIKKILRF